jgi:hypothetical protein
MSNDPDVIRGQIEATRANLSADVNELGDKVSPSRIVRRQSHRIKDAAAWVTDRMLGSADTAASTASDAASAVGGAISEAPKRLVRQTEGSPVAPGLIAFGFGMLLAAMFPASRQEAHAAAAVKEQAQPLVGEVTAAAKDVAANLRQPAQDALESVKAMASDAMDTVKDAGVTAAADVTEQARDAKDTLQQQVTSG